MAVKTYNTKAEANRANAERSTGPRTEEGKRIASYNALKTGLTGRTVLLPTDNFVEYQAHLDRVTARYLPESDEEKLLAETIAHIEWRLFRIPTLETGILAVGRKHFADDHPEQPLDVRLAMIDAEVHLAFQKQLANLALQESRLRRQHEREVAKLQALAKERETARRTTLTEVVELYKDCRSKKKPFPYQHLRSLGFVFSLEDLKLRLVRDETAYASRLWREIGTREALRTWNFDLEMA